MLDCFIVYLPCTAHRLVMPGNGGKSTKSCDKPVSFSLLWKFCVARTKQNNYNFCYAKLRDFLVAQFNERKGQTKENKIDDDDKTGLFHLRSKLLLFSFTLATSTSTTTTTYSPSTTTRNAVASSISHAFVGRISKPLDRSFFTESSISKPCWFNWSYPAP